MAPAARGPDQIVIRIPRAGGNARAYIYPRLDSVVASISSAPPIARALAFDPDDGTLAFLDDKGQPRRLDLRASEARTASKEKLTSLSSANGSAIFGINAKGSVLRITPTGDWTFDPPSPAKRVYPQRDGSVVIAGTRGGRTELWLIRPTDDEILATVTLPLDATSGTQVGDRIYFASDSGLVGARVRDLSRVKTISLRKKVKALAPTPSGDRVYVALDDTNELSIVDRYSESISGTIELPGIPDQLRMDPLGQVLLVKPATPGDSAWVVSLGTDKLAGSISGQWRSDLPMVLPGDLILSAQGGDVALINAGDLKERQRISDGAADYWFFTTWNGFRPRSQDLDRPVQFEPPDSAVGTDSSQFPAAQDSAFQPPLRDAAPTMVIPPNASAPHARTFMVSFAAVLTEQKANDAAQAINVNGMRPRVVAIPQGATTVYRVVLGPYGSREEAEKIGRDSGRPYWVYEDSQ